MHPWYQQRIGNANGSDFISAEIAQKQNAVFIRD
jgi:hypothetical protein